MTCIVFYTIIFKFIYYFIFYLTPYCTNITNNDDYWLVYNKNLFTLVSKLWLWVCIDHSYLIIPRSLPPFILTNIYDNQTIRRLDGGDLWSDPQTWTPITTAGLFWTDHCKWKRLIIVYTQSTIHVISPPFTLVCPLDTTTESATSCYGRRNKVEVTRGCECMQGSTWGECMCVRGSL